jgi:hypothetical protein
MIFFRCVFFNLGSSFTTSRELKGDTDVAHWNFIFIVLHCVEELLTSHGLVFLAQHPHAPHKNISSHQSIEASLMLLSVIKLISTSVINDEFPFNVLFPQALVAII